MASDQSQPKKTSIPYLQRKYKLSYQAAKEMYEGGTMPVETPVEQKFCYNGNFFYSREDFENAVIEHAKAIATEKEIYEFFNSIAKVISTNMQIYNIEKTNGEMNVFYDDILIVSLEKFLNEDLERPKYKEK